DVLLRQYVPPPYRCWGPVCRSLSNCGPGRFESIRDPPAKTHHQSPRALLRDLRGSQFRLHFVRVSEAAKRQSSATALLPASIRVGLWKRASVSDYVAAVLPRSVTLRKGRTEERAESS